MKQIPLLLLFIFIASCNGPNKKVVLENNVGKFNNTAEDPYFIETYDTISTHGPHNITRNILQDKSGNYWLATWEGIIRYDGKVFTNITLQENLRHFHVFSLLEDKAGNLWFGTIGGGVYRYDPLKTGSKSFVNFTKAEGLCSNTVTCMLEDKEGNIWFGTDNGISRYDGSFFINFTMKEGLCSNSVNAIAQDKTGKFWFGTDGGVSCYDSEVTSGKGFTNFTKKEEVPFFNVRSIIEDKKGNIWIGSEDGLFCYNPNEKSLTNITTDFTSYIFEDKAGSLWLSAENATLNQITLNGTAPKSASDGMALYRYNPEDASGKAFTKIADKNSLNCNQIFGVTEDNAGNIWLGTERGINRYDGKSFDNFNGAGQ